jgi:hypothetical protein
VFTNGWQFLDQKKDKRDFKKRSFFPGLANEDLFLKLGVFNLIIKRASNFVILTHFVKMRARSRRLIIELNYEMQLLTRC